jgi:BirA family biotin operon repressor/biotin-[acetyl-CoA-carboxylase] ligase
LKWPNDVLVGDRKLAGILAEVALQSTIVVGVGLNITLHPDEAGGPNATSLPDLGVEAPDRDALVTRLLHELGCRVNVWPEFGTPARILESGSCLTWGFLNADGRFGVLNR